jgi:hypothetical protein
MKQGNSTMFDRWEIAISAYLTARFIFITQPAAATS